MCAGSNSTDRLVGMDFLYQEADFGPSLSSLDADVVLAGGDNKGCDGVSAGAEGKIALILRGGCTFTDKVINAQNAGAVTVMPLPCILCLELSIGKGRG